MRFLAALAFRTDRPMQGLPLPPGARLEPAAAPVAWTVAPPPGRPRVVIVGSGPAGTFCALRLLDYGIEPVLLERGAPMSERVRAVAGLWQDAVLDPEANAQFGEGGAGTFSDGKLTTRIGHPAIRYVIETFVRFGANPKVLYLARPHVGTDVIRKCSVLIRKDAEARGAVYRFRSPLVDLRFRDGAVAAAVLASGEEIPCDALVLAPGHSARDTLEMLHRHGVGMRQKPFAMGVRVEHPQDLVDRSQYGPEPGPPQPGPGRLQAGLQPRPGPRRLLASACAPGRGDPVRLRAGRGGGERHEQRQARFGLRQFRAGGQGQHRRFRVGAPAGRHVLPAQVGAGRVPRRGRDLRRPGHQRPGFPPGQGLGQLPATSFRPFAVPADITTCLPGFVQEQLRAAIPDFDRKLHGFTSRQALLLAIESRTSSPVQLLRGTTANRQPPRALPLRRGRRVRRRHHLGGGGRDPGGGVDRPQGGAPAFLPFQRNVKAGEYATEY